jgi:hypothetical protein
MAERPLPAADSGSSPDDPRLHRVQRLAYVLDNSIRIPIIDYRIGADVLIGLVPGLGDIIGLLLAGYIVVEAARFGVPRATLLRMATNVAVDALAGTVPLLGDVVDATYKANARNLKLLEKHLGVESGRQRKADRRFLVAVAVVLGLAVVAVALLVYLLLDLLVLALNSAAGL